MSPQEYFDAWFRIRRAGDPQAEITKARRRYGFIIVVMGAFSGAVSVLLPEFAALVIGIGVGSVVGAIATLEKRIHGLQKNWALLEDVVDWDRLEQRIREKPDADV